MNAGLNLYSIRNLVKTEEDYLATVLKLKEMGYSYLQHAGTYDPAMIDRIRKAADMPIVLTHMSFDRITSDTDKLMEEHASFGCRNIGLGSIPIVDMVTEEHTVDEKICKAKLEALNKAGEHMKKNGFQFFLHNHHYEFMRMSNGERIFDYIIENAPHINFTLDTYWLQHAGVDVLATIEKLKGRIGCVHLKDYKIVVNTKLDYFDACPAYESVGYGNMDFKAIVPKMKEAGTQYFLVEHDSAANMPDPMAIVEQSIRYIKAEL